jgi:HlyD family secretion protein
LVFDTLYREGDWVAAGKPVIVLLPPANIKVRAFVAQEKLGLIHQGDSVSVSVDGVAAPYEGRITFISPKSEFTPPVIYSQDMREKLVFLVEISFDPKIAAKLHPGQPVDPRFKW